MAGKRTITGTVVSNKNEQTIIVTTERRVMHPIYKKAYNVTKKFVAHDAENSAKVGDTVTMEESRPLSRTKRFRLVTDGQPADKPAKADKAAKEKA